MADTVLPGIALPYTGIPLVDHGFTIISQQLARTATDLQTALNTSGGGGGTGGTGTGGSPTNSPVPTGITVTANPDGSMDVTLTWDYTQGTVQADFLVLFWKQGSAPLAPPITDDKALLLAHTARSFTFNGWNPNSNYRFGIAAGRKDTAGTSVGVGTIVAPTSAPDWADVSATGNYTASIAGATASTVVANATNGQTAYSGTVNYRSAGAPTNNPVPASLTTGTDSDGSARYTLAWNYTQSTLKADGFFFFVKEGNTGTFALTDPHFELGAQNAGTFSTSITLKGYPSDRSLSFAAASFRRTEAGLEIGTIVSSAASPDWQGVTTGTPNYAGAIFGVEQHNFLVRSVGGFATGTEAILKDGQSLVWTGRDPEFIGAPGFVRAVHGLSYNLSVYDLTAKQVVYQHCYDLFDFGAATTADEVFPITASGGAANCGATGKFGLGITTTATAGQSGFFYSGAASAFYASLKWVELWFRHSTSPSAQGTILGFGQNGTSGSGYSFAVLLLETDGKVTARAFNGTSAFALTSTGVVTDGADHHIAAAITGGNLHLWVDGIHQSVTVGGLTTFTGAAPGGVLFLQIGFSGNAGQLLGTSVYDEIILSTNDQLRANGTNFTVSTIEFSDYMGGASGTHAVFHCQEPWDRVTNARTPAKALANILSGYSSLQGAVPSTRYLFVIQAGNEPQTNRLLDGLPDVLERIGGRKALFTASSFQQFSAYILIGEPGKGPGNGLESYMGTVGSDTTALTEIAFQTQADRVVGLTGGGWDPLDIPGAPTNSPVATSVSVSSSPTGQDVISVGWTYTQPALSGSNKLADGFILYVKTGDSGTPASAATAAYQVDVASRSFTMQSPLNQTWSFAVAAFRRTTSGIEVGSPITSAGAPDWQGVGGVSQVTNTGLGDASVSTGKVQDSSISESKIQSLAVTTAKIQDLAVTNAKIGDLSAAKITTGLLTVNPSGTGATAIFVDNSGKVRLKSMVSSPSKVSFEDSGGTERAYISGDAAGGVVVANSSAYILLDSPQVVMLGSEVDIANPHFSVIGGAVGAQVGYITVRNISTGISFKIPVHNV